MKHFGGISAVAKFKMALRSGGGKAIILDWSKVNIQRCKRNNKWKTCHKVKSVFLESNIKWACTAHDTADPFTIGWIILMHSSNIEHGVLVKYIDQLSTPISLNLIYSINNMNFRLLLSNWFSS